MSKRCCFAGHSEIYNADSIYADLEKLVEQLITKENVKEFWVGNYGGFDKLSAKVIKALKEKYSDIQLSLVIPYLTVEINEYKEKYYEKYDEILIADISEKTPKRLKILKCNEFMVKNSDFLVCFVEFEWGGAAKTLEYAKKKKDIMVFNLAQNKKSKSPTERFYSILQNLSV